METVGSYLRHRPEGRSSENLESRFTESATSPGQKHLQGSPMVPTWSLLLALLLLSCNAICSYNSSFFNKIAQAGYFAKTRNVLAKVNSRVWISENCVSVQSSCGESLLLVSHCRVLSYHHRAGEGLVYIHPFYKGIISFCEASILTP